MEVICLEERAFYELVEQVVKRLEDQRGAKADKWVDDEEAMRVLGIKSKTTLQKLRDEGKIRFSQAHRNVILYDRDSLYAHLDRHAHDPY